MVGRVFYTGKVISNWDPEGMGRIKVQLNGFSSEPGKIMEGGWARLMTPAAGPTRGQLWLPEVDDEVIVIQLHMTGELVVLGSLYNGVQLPPDKNPDGYNNTKIIKTRSGHQVIFSEVGTIETITIKTPNDTCEIMLENSPLMPKVTVKAPVVDIMTPAMMPVTTPPVPPVTTPPVPPPPVAPMMTPTPTMPPVPGVPPIPPPPGLGPAADAAPVVRATLDSRTILGPRLDVTAPVIQLISPIPIPPVPPPPPGPESSAAPPPPAPPPPPTLLPPCLFRMQTVGALGTMTLYSNTLNIIADSVNMLSTALVGPTPTAVDKRIIEAAKRALLAVFTAEQVALTADETMAAAAKTAVLSALEASSTTPPPQV